MSTRSRPRFWLITLAALVVAGAGLALGAWQLDRGRQKVALHQAMAARERLPAVGNAALLAAGEGALLHRPVVVRGRWVPQRTVFLDNRQMQGRQGFYVVTPLLLEGGGGAAVLVERGWVPRNFEHREQLPTVPTPAGVVAVHGRVAPPPARLYDLGRAPAGAIRQNLDLTGFRAETGLPLLDLAVRQTGNDASDGLQRQWPEPASGAEKNYGYAFQWWALAALTTILYVWFQFIAPRRKAPPA
ncbi:SURF1 family protein [Ramlibacter sp.]|uniref:SURF1 family protein n=1 Tax=Ramlibacter sp. TaxID=1917967 RepID=UPI002BDCF160|nr:SURF1 family protein [Ramlibacter sp.]HWI81453.1 SURF1 family protein [Ramlibacter sp.]